MDKKQVNLDIQIKTKHEEIIKKIFNEGYSAQTDKEALCILKTFGLDGEVTFGDEEVTVVVTGELKKELNIEINIPEKPEDFKEPDFERPAKPSGFVERS